ncbi:unnamed protein product [Arctia plantaginis]|uniref:Odorant receptor n=1 Tax=Arctia plantaginis TaxID=874455 RepID=A0A8S0ZEQ2_ARCPL|nr:unnamed protein product [Arctia plantaginis]
MWESIRKFGPEYYDLPTMLSNVSDMLRVLTLNIDGRNKKRIPIGYIILTTVASILYIYAYVFSAFWFSFWHAAEIGEVSGAFAEFSLSITSHVVIVRLFYMLLHKEKLEVLINKYLDQDARIPKGSRFFNNMMKTLKQVKRRGIIFWTILLVDPAVYIIKPLLTPGRHLTLDTFVIYGLEPMLESPNYEIATVVMATGVTLICYSVANVTCFWIVTIGYIEAQMLALSEEIKHIYGDAVYHCKKTIDTNNNYTLVVNKNASKDTVAAIINQYIKEHLKDIIVKHSTNISYVKEIDEIMSIPNAVGFLYLILGLTAELLGGLEKTWLQLPFTMLQLSVDCYLGQKVKDANDKFEQAVYDCKWEKFNKSNRKIVLMMLQNSQKTMTLSAGGMAILNLRCLMSIIKTTYSAYTTLRTMV